MKVNNETNYKTNNLRKLFTEVIKRNEKLEGALAIYQKRALRIKVVYTKATFRTRKADESKPLSADNIKHTTISDSYHGCATVHGYNLTLRIPRDVPINLPTLAYLLDHEFMHIRGYRHNKMEPYNHWDTHNYQWAETFVINKKEETEKPKVNLVDKRYKHVLEMIKKKEKQIKVLKHSLEKWNKKRKYYEKANQQ